eukprot:m.133030 g.133030  ORF g.133030 m.133030 type:complete len:69 (-) comp14662_c2_seq2:201-407(-)
MMIYDIQASTTHEQLNEEEQKSAGVKEVLNALKTTSLIINLSLLASWQDFIRVSVGIEHIDDIKVHLD